MNCQIGYQVLVTFDFLFAVVEVSLRVTLTLTDCTASWVTWFFWVLALDWKKLIFDCIFCPFHPGSSAGLWEMQMTWSTASDDLETFPFSGSEENLLMTYSWISFFLIAFWDSLIGFWI